MTQTAADLWAKVRGSFIQEQEEEEAGLLASLNEATTLNRVQVRCRFPVYMHS